MRTVITEEVVYSWEDVKNDAELLDKVLDEHRDINTEHQGWWDMVYEDWTEKLEDLGYRNIDICFSGFHSQGDGASFTGNVDVLAWIKTNDETNKYKRIAKLMYEGIIDIQDDRIVRDRWHHYVHENTTTFHFSTYYEGGACQDYDNIDMILNDLESDIYLHHKNLNSEIYSSLNETHDYLTSDQSVADTLEANDYEFNINGEII
jgi:hypothetical protein